MIEKINTVKYNNCEEIVEKKSRFIANLFYVENEQEAIEKIKEVKKKYHDARHNCYSYRVIENGEIIQRSSDDGEPSGTAGAPMLNILEKNNIVNVLIVVTRYFGGILLGTGGLVKAYSTALQLAINKNILEEKEEGYECEILTSYDNSKKLEYFLKINDIQILKREYAENIRILVDISEADYLKLEIEFPKSLYKDIKYRIIYKKIIAKKGTK